MFLRKILCFFLTSSLYFAYCQPMDSSHIMTCKNLSIKQPGNTRITDSNLVSFNITLGNTVHIVSPEPITYVDITSSYVEGDLPDKKIFRFKADSTKLKEGDVFNVSIVTNSFIVVYKLVCYKRGSLSPDNYVITVNPMQAVQFNQYGYLGQEDFSKLSLQALGKKRSIYNVSNRAYDMSLWINNIFTIGDFLIFDVGAKNKSKIQFDVDEIRFKLIDKYNVNAAVSQDLELQPVYQFYNIANTVIEKNWRNFYVFRKFTFPTQKLFNIEMTEKQISGRKIDLKIEYNQILHSKFLL